jgi:hypothetical protein
MTNDMPQSIYLKLFGAHILQVGQTHFISLRYPLSGLLLLSHLMHTYLLSFEQSSAIQAHLGGSCAPQETAACNGAAGAYGMLRHHSWKVLSLRKVHCYPSTFTFSTLFERTISRIFLSFPFLFFTLASL